ncbi:hypothetical protein RRG08_022418 [Elysia crispata]|uniref:Uncharacterized protein n=1 Tax=Elysia crispata TaxID=231223 RepID=A0AAE1D8A8_9GAST|nr:hypothetical protein RRG08_022418 [Elysia crispata]
MCPDLINSCAELAGPGPITHRSNLLMRRHGPGPSDQTTTRRGSEAAGRMDARRHQSKTLLVLLLKIMMVFRLSLAALRLVTIDTQYPQATSGLHS